MDLQSEIKLTEKMLLVWSAAKILQMNDVSIHSPSCPSTAYAKFFLYTTKTCHFSAPSVYFEAIKCLHFHPDFYFGFNCVL